MWFSRYVVRLKLNCFRRMGLSGLEPPTSRLSGVRSNQLSYKPIEIWHPPALPCRLQHSTIGRLGLNRRVRDGNGCVPQPHRHQNSSEPFFKSESFLIGSPKSFAFSRSRLRRLCSQVHQSAPESKLSSLLSDPVRAITHDSRRFNSI